MFGLLASMRSGLVHVDRFQQHSCLGMLGQNVPKLVVYAYSILTARGLALRGHVARPLFVLWSPQFGRLGSVAC